MAVIASATARSVVTILYDLVVADAEAKDKFWSHHERALSASLYESHYASTGLSWQAADDNCVLLGGHLANIHSVGELDSMVNSTIALQGTWNWYEV